MVPCRLNLMVMVMNQVHYCHVFYVQELLQSHSECFITVKPMNDDLGAIVSNRARLAKLLMDLLLW